MELNRIYLLVILGVAIAFLALITMQLFTALIAIVFLVIVLILRDSKVWVESLVDKLASAKAAAVKESAVTNETVAELRKEIARLEERLDSLAEGSAITQIQARHFFHQATILASCFII